MGIKRYVVGFVVGVLLATASAGIAATSGVNLWVTRAGMTCGFGTGPQGKGVACVQTNRKGYAVTLTDTKVVVWLGSRAVFKQAQR